MGSFSATKYMGDDRAVFEEAVSTREAGLYTCQITVDQVTHGLQLQSLWGIPTAAAVS